MRYQAVEVRQTSFGGARAAKSVDAPIPCTYMRCTYVFLMLTTRKREATASIKEAAKVYEQSSPPKASNIIEMDCRGLEFVEFKPDVYT